MDEVEGTEPSDGQEFEQVEASTETQNHSPEVQPEPANPFWGDVEELVGPNVYKVIQPHLAKTDAEYSRKIAAVNEQLKPWKSFADQGYEPAQMEQALGLVRMLNEQPEVVHQGLTDFLQREGHLPTQQELQEEVLDDEDDEPEEDPRDLRIRGLEENQRQMIEFFRGQAEAAQQQQVAEEANSWVDSEIEALKGLNKGYTDQDIHMILQMAAWEAQQSGKPVQGLASAEKAYSEHRNRLMTTPRPGQSAPNVPSGGGGTPGSGAAPAGNLSREDRIALVAQRLQSNKN